MSASPGGFAGSRRFLTTAVLLLLAIHAALSWSSRRRWVLDALDDARYILLGRALLSGEYIDISRIDRLPEPLYPPGYPALLAATSLVAGERVAAFAALGVLLSTATLALVFLTVRRVWSAPAGVLTVAVLAVNPWLVKSAGTIASETPFTFWVVLTIYLLVRAQGSEHRGYLWAAGAAAIIAALTRSAGVALVAAVSLHWLLERRWRAVLVFGVLSLATVGAWQLHTKRVWASHEVDLSYNKDMAQGPRHLSRAEVLARRVVRNARTYSMVHAPTLAPAPVVDGTRADNAAFGLLIVAALTAGGVAAWRRARIAVLFTGVMLALLVAWPFAPNRFAIPLIPAAVPLGLAGAALATRRFGPRASVAAVLLGGGVAALTGTAQTASLVSSRACGTGQETMPPAACVTAHERDYYAALSYVNTAMPADAVLMARLGATLYYYTGRKVTAFRPPIENTTVTLTEAMQRRGASFVMLATTERAIRATVERLDASCGELMLEQAFGTEAMWLRPRRADDPPGDDAACRAVRTYRDTHPDLMARR